MFQILLQENFTLQHISIIPVSFYFFFKLALLEMFCHVTTTADSLRLLLTCKKNSVAHLRNDVATHIAIRDAISLVQKNVVVQGHIHEQNKNQPQWLKFWVRRQLF